MNISISIMCIDFKNMGEQIGLLNGFTDSYHWDIMDGHYVPNLALSTDMLPSLNPVIEKPIHAHLMVRRPQDYVTPLLELGVKEITFHVDTVNSQFFRLKNQIKDAGAGVGMALNPMERVELLDWVIDDLDSITVMTVDPGFAGQPFIDSMLRKIANLKELKLKNGHQFEIEVDGGVNPKTMDRLIDAGAERFVLGSSGLFNLAENLEKSIEIAKKYIPFKNSKRGV